MKTRFLLVPMLAILATACGSDNDASPVSTPPQPQMNTALFGSWRSNCQVLEDDSGSMRTIMKIAADGTIESTDSVYNNLTCTAPTAGQSKTTMRYSLLSNTANDYFLRLTDFAATPPDPELDSVIESVARFSIDTPDSARLKLVAGAYRDENGNPVLIPADQLGPELTLTRLYENESVESAPTARKPLGHTSHDCPWTFYFRCFSK
jgi:hypothetical protein